MANYKLSEARAAFQRSSYSLLRKSAQQILAEAAREFTPSKRYDIFLSHSFKDAEVILGVKVLLEQEGFSVYVDWIDDAQLDREKVNAATANVLRERMRACESLIYATSTNARESKWMPWELGYFDGFKGKVFILPLLADYESTFVGQEYLGLYPTVEKLPSSATERKAGFIRTNPRLGTREYVTLRESVGAPTMRFR